MTAKKPKNVGAATKNSMTVAWKGQMRVFSLEVQGKDFKKNAEEFAKKHGGEIVE